MKRVKWLFMPRPASVALLIATATLLVSPSLGIRVHSPWPQETGEIYNSERNGRQIKLTRPIDGLTLYRVNQYIFPTIILTGSNIVSHLGLPYVVIASTLFWFLFAFILLQLIGAKMGVDRGNWRITPHDSRTVILVLLITTMLFLLVWWPQMINDYWMGKFDWLHRTRES